MQKVVVGQETESRWLLLSTFTGAENIPGSGEAAKAGSTGEVMSERAVISGTSADTIPSMQSILRKVNLLPPVSDVRTPLHFRLARIANPVLLFVPLARPDIRAPPPGSVSVEFPKEPLSPLPPYIDSRLFVPICFRSPYCLLQNLQPITVVCFWQCCEVICYIQYS